MTATLDITAPPTPRSTRRAAIAIILVMTVIAGFLAASNYYAEKQDVERLLSASASALDYQTDRSFRAIDDLLKDAAGRINLDQWPDATLTPWLQGRLSALPEIHNVLVLRPDGRSIALGPTAHDEVGDFIDASDREYFRYHFAHREDHGLHIGNPITSRLDGFSGIPLSRAVFNDQGQIVGVIRALIDPQFLAKSLSMVRAIEVGFNTLIRADGIVVARSPDQEQFIGKSIAGGTLFKEVLPREATGVGEFISPLDSAPRILAYRRLDHYPLIVVAGVPHAAAFAEWRERMVWIMALLAGLAASLYSVAAWSDRREHQRAALVIAAQQAEGQVVRTQQQFLDAIETINDGFALYDPEDRLIVCNEQYRAMFADAEDAIQPGNRYTDILRVVAERGILDLDGRALENFVAERLAEHNVPTGRAALYPLKNGRWLVSKEFRTRDGGVVATRSDVSELRRRELEVEALKKRYELILGSAGDGIIGIDADEFIVFANHTACCMLGVDKGALDGLNYRNTLCGPLGEGLPAFPLDGADAVPGEARFLGANGDSFIGEFVLAPIREDERFDGAVLVFRDISLRKQYEAGVADQQKRLEREVLERTRKLSTEIEQRSRTEEALRKSQGRLVGITSTLVEGVLLVDIYGHILFANRSAHRLLVDEGRNLSGTDLDDVFQTLRGGKSADFAASRFQEAITSGGTVIDDDAVFVRADQRRLSIAFAAAPLVEEGKRRGVVISFRSIEALKAAQREALQSSRLASVGQLAAGIAHEINTPIQYVGDNLRFLRDSSDSFAQAIGGLKCLLDDTEHANAAAQLFIDKDIDYLLDEFALATVQSLEGVDHVAHIVRSMKEFSHPGTTAKVTADLNRAVDSVVTVSHNEWRQVATLETDLSPTLPLILCFPADINQVLLNLIVNAAHAIESLKQPTLGVIGVSTRLDGDAVEIRVSDSGPGVPEDVRDKIFDPFFTTKEVGKGTGQGLSICRDVVVNKHGGKLFLDDTVGGGATFVVRLPAKEPPPLAE